MIARASRYRRALRRRRRARAKCDAVEAHVANVIKAHVRRHPLPEDTRRQLEDSLANGHELCCEAGRANIEQIVTDPIWRDVLHAWAYDHASCKYAHREGAEYAAKLRRFWGEVAEGDRDRWIENEVP